MDNQSKPVESIYVVQTTRVGLGPETGGWVGLSGTKAGEWTMKRPEGRRPWSKPPSGYDSLAEQEIRA